MPASSMASYRPHKDKYWHTSSSVLALPSIFRICLEGIECSEYMNVSYLDAEPPAKRWEKFGDIEVI